MENNSEISTLSDRLTILEEKESIRDVIYSYAYNVDSKNMDELMALFHDEVFFHYLNQNLEHRGKPNLTPFFQGIFDTYDVIIHKIMNIMIQIEGHKASARSYWMVYEIFKKGGERCGEGHYYQKLAKMADGWKIQDHVIDGTYFRVDKQELFRR